MADLTSANVRSLTAWRELSKRQLVRRLEIHGAEVGGATNKIPAQALGMRVIEEGSVAYDRNAGAAVAAVPNHDGSFLFLYPAVDGATGPADVATEPTPNGLYLTVKGY